MFLLENGSVGRVLRYFLHIHVHCTCISSGHTYIHDYHCSMNSKFGKRKYFRNGPVYLEENRIWFWEASQFTFTGRQEGRSFCISINCNNKISRCCSTVFVNTFGELQNSDNSLKPTFITTHIYSFEEGVINFTKYFVGKISCVALHLLITQFSKNEFLILVRHILSVKFKGYLWSVALLPTEGRQS